MSANELDMSYLHEQGYDGPGDMWGEFNGLKELISNENKSVCIHYFAPRLQLRWSLLQGISQIDLIFNIVF